VEKEVTTLTITEKTHYELYKLKRRLRKRSFDDLLRYLISHYYSTEKRGRELEAGGGRGGTEWAGRSD
jgi:predicted CopG family antitoxin